MKIFKSKISQIIVVTICALVITITSICIANSNKYKPVSVKTKHKLESIYSGNDNEIAYFIGNMLYLPYSIFDFDMGPEYPYYEDIFEGGNKNTSSGPEIFNPNSSVDSTGGSHWDNALNWYTGSTGGNKNQANSTEGNNLDFSKTNVQVENVDEADIIKTDGNYTYSLSENEVIITDVTEVNSPKIVSRITSASCIPVDMMLYDKYLVVINQLSATKYSTDVKIYDITDKSNPTLNKSFRIDKQYYTSRMINGNLYIISNGNLKKENGEIVAYYEEDNEKINRNLNKMYYFKDNSSDYETIISHINLNELEEASFDVQSYFSEVDNIYVSENNIYIANEDYAEEKIANNILKIFGIKGIWGYLVDDYEYNGYETNIIKLQIKENGKIKFVAKNKIEGEVVDQFSFDEYDSNLRIAVQDKYNGSKIVILDKKLKKIGESSYVGKNEKMYSSRFVGEKAYLVTYRNIDPLFVFDLSNPKSPKVLGELEIPGYSTYLHPYDENHIIGIGMQTKEEVRKNDEGKIISTRAYVTGMKMALFDVSDVNNPKQISEVTIGDKSTKSAILTNHKALLFSKEKELIAIPINSYKEEIAEKEVESQNIDDLIKSYDTDSKYISEGYLVYNINPKDGINLKGVITHNEESNESSYKSSQLLRGIYIKDNLITISQHMLKINRLDNLKELSSMEI